MSLSFAPAVIIIIHIFVSGKGNSLTVQASGKKENPANISGVFRRIQGQYSYVILTLALTVSEPDCIGVAAAPAISMPYLALRS